MTQVTTLTRDGSVRTALAKSTQLRRGVLTILTSHDWKWRPGFLTLRVRAEGPGGRVREWVNGPKGWAVAAKAKARRRSK